MKQSTEITDDGASTIEKAEIIAGLIAQLGEEYRDVIASCTEIRKEAFRRGGKDGAMDAAGFVGNDQVDLLIAGALQAAGLGGVLTVPASSIRNVANLSGELRLRITRAKVFRSKPAPPSTEPGDSESLDWLRNAGTNPRPDPAGRSMRVSDQVNKRLSDHVKTVQSGVGMPRSREAS